MDLSYTQHQHYGYTWICTTHKDENLNANNNPPGSPAAHVHKMYYLDMNERHQQYTNTVFNWNQFTETFLSTYMFRVHIRQTNAAASLVTFSYTQPDPAENCHCNFCVRWKKNKTLE